jgi:hypothetical protein
MLMQSLIDKREKVQKQAQKSLCILFQNKKIDRLHRPLAAFHGFVTTVFNHQMSIQTTKATASVVASKNTVMVLNFLAAALQLMPLTLCADIDTKVLRLTSIDDA